MNSHLASRKPDNFVEDLANSSLLAAISALFSDSLDTICFVQTYSELPRGKQTVIEERK